MMKLLVSSMIDKLGNVGEKYFVEDNKVKFTKKLSPEDVVGIIFNNNGKNIKVQASDYIQRYYEDFSLKVSAAAFCQRRQQIKYDIFIDVNNLLIGELYDKIVAKIKDKDNYICKHKGMSVLAMDSSVMNLPNHPLTKEQYHLESKLGAEPLPRGRFSGITDTMTNMVLSSKFMVYQSSEAKLAIEQINELKDIINLKNSIFLGDRGYDSIELMLNIMEHGSYFIIRLNKKMFQKERKNIMGNDEIIYVNMNETRLKNVSNLELKKKYSEEGRIKLRIIEVPLKTTRKEDGDEEEETIEYLVTNLFEDKMPYDDFKELYHKRWNIETEFRRLKSILEIENMSGRKEICIKQDIYAKTLLYNMVMALRLEVKKITRKSSKNGELTYENNVSTALGLFKNRIIDLLQIKDKEIKEEIILKGIMEEMITNLASSKKNPPNTERETKDKTNKYPGNIKRA